MAEEYDNFNVEDIAKRWQKYLDMIDGVNPLVLKTLKVIEEKKLKINSILDLGCGPGFDSNCFIENGYDVLAMDYNANCLSKIEHNFPKLKTNTKFQFEVARIEDFQWKKFEIILCIKVLPFLEGKLFDNAISSIKQNIDNGGLFVGSFFGEEDEWNDLSLISKQKLLFLFKDFKIIYFDEQKGDIKAVSGITKKAHVFKIIAQKK